MRLWRSPLLQFPTKPTTACPPSSLLVCFLPAPYSVFFLHHFSSHRHQHTQILIHIQCFWLCFSSISSLSYTVCLLFSSASYPHKVVSLHTYQVIHIKLIHIQLLLTSPQLDKIERALNFIPFDAAVVGLKTLMLGLSSLFNLLHTKGPIIFANPPIASKFCRWKTGNQIESICPTCYDFRSKTSLYWFFHQAILYFHGQIL